MCRKAGFLIFDGLLELRRLRESLLDMIRPHEVEKLCIEGLPINELNPIFPILHSDNIKRIKTL